LQLQADTEATVTMLCVAGLHKKKLNKKRWQNTKNVKNVKKHDKKL